MRLTGSQSGHGMVLYIFQLLGSCCDHIQTEYAAFISDSVQSTICDDSETPVKYCPIARHDRAFTVLVKLSHAMLQG